MKCPKTRKNQLLFTRNQGKRLKTVAHKLENLGKIKLFTMKFPLKEAEKQATQTFEPKNKEKEGKKKDEHQKIKSKTNNSEI